MNAADILYVHASILVCRSPIALAPTIHTTKTLREIKIYEKIRIGTSTPTTKKKLTYDIYMNVVPYIPYLWQSNDTSTSGMYRVRMIGRKNNSAQQNTSHSTAHPQHNYTKNTYTRASPGKQTSACCI